MGYVEVFHNGEDEPPMILGDHFLKDVIHDPYAPDEQWITCQMCNEQVLVTDICVTLDLDHYGNAIWQCIKCHTVNG